MVVILINCTVFFSNRYARVWVGLQRAADGQPDKWTNGGNFVPNLYPGIVLNVSRAGLDNGKLCSVADRNAQSALANAVCSDYYDRICETVKTSVYKVRPSGQVAKDVGPGQPRAAESVLSCVRTCRRELTCVAISHDGVTCQLHFPQAGRNLTVTSIPKMYFLLE
ncbi:uncharacterized protein LOC112562935 [Pomacea canaliculata]|uniref:uncharacterized protein LOC112562935 n=1 Tax=Pomacea canaliculata TaxID=400727 RepID=UPI000D72C2BB|nr:uncharacterized protein LOC112562935 [Pomacea canaliculata]